VNQYIAPYHLPDEAILLSTFPELKLRENETADYYYAQIEKCLSESKKKREQKFPESLKALDDLCGNSMPSDHSFWANSKVQIVDGEKTGSGIPNTTIKAIESIYEDHILKAYERAKLSGIKGKMQGTIPGWLESEIQTLYEKRKPKVSWRKQLRMFAASARNSQMIATQQRESKRFEPLEGMPPNPGLKLKRKQKIALAIDTSGSVGDEQLGSFFNEIDGIYQQGADITVIECDAQVQRTYPYTGKRPTKVKGRGGTSFEPVMLWLKNSNKQFDGCIYLTDGESAEPDTKPTCKLLWVVVGGGGGEHLKFGKQISLDVGN
jgi:predicted metal-dependent peptidase